MESNRRVSEILVETGAFRDLDKPVILTSGELGVYYINTEQVVQDGGKWNEYAENSTGMIEHALMMTRKKPSFKEIIHTLCERIDGITRSYICAAISGGQRRDWLFSGPVANQLNLTHIALYKNGKIEILVRDKAQRKFESNPQNVAEYDYRPRVIHVADLMTTGSSAYDGRTQPASGWITMLRNEGFQINDMFNVVTRLQGGEENLAVAEVTANSLVAIDEGFLRQHSKQPEVAVEYFKNPREWSEGYIRNKGIDAFVGAFNPDVDEAKKFDKLDRARKFLRVYDGVLRESGRLKELEIAVAMEYGKSLNDIIGGN